MKTIIGYVYSNKHKTLVAIEREIEEEPKLEEKIYTYFKEQVQRKLKGDKNYAL